jgi:hypothetical protein
MSSCSECRNYLIIPHKHRKLLIPLFNQLHWVLSYSLELRRYGSSRERLKCCNMWGLKFLVSPHPFVCVWKILFHFVVSGYCSASCSTCLSSCVFGFACLHTDMFKTWHFLLTASGIPQSELLRTRRSMSLWRCGRTPNQQLPPNSASRQPGTKRMWLCLIHYDSRISSCTLYHIYIYICKIWLQKFCHLVAKRLSATLSNSCSNNNIAIYAALTCKLH